MRGASLSPLGAMRAHDRAPARILRRDESGGFCEAFPGDGRSPVRAGVARLDGLVPTPRLAEPRAEALPRGGQHPSGGRAADGRDLWPARGGGARPGPRFDAPVQQGGYAWWYLDALSADGRHGLTLIAFVGSVFSPYYAWARRRGHADPLNHCALNVALYGRRGPSWACTERGRSSLARRPDALAIGRSNLWWSGTDLVIEIDEVTAPWPTRLRGTVRVKPEAVSTCVFDLDAKGRHRWWPIAPSAHIEVELASPDLCWSGRGYLDTNDGDEPLADAFSHWHWSRAALSRGRAAVLYDVVRRSGEHASLALHVGSDGSVAETNLPPAAPLPRSRWGIVRETRADENSDPRLQRTLEDGPFYARSVLTSRIADEPVTAIHESLSLERFRTSWVQAMLPFRMPRAPG